MSPGLRIQVPVPGPHGPLVAVGEQIAPALLKGSITLFCVTNFEQKVIIVR